MRTTSTCGSRAPWELELLFCAFKSPSLPLRSLTPHSFPLQASFPATLLSLGPTSLVIGRPGACVAWLWTFSRVPAKKMSRPICTYTRIYLIRSVVLRGWEQCLFFVLLLLSCRFLYVLCPGSSSSCGVKSLSDTSICISGGRLGCVEASTRPPDWSQGLLGLGI